MTADKRAAPQLVDAAPALAAAGLTKTYDGVVALQPLDLSVGGGESVALIGHNGSGKSTLLRMAAGLVETVSNKLSSEGGVANVSFAIASFNLST